MECNIDVGWHTKKTTVPRVNGMIDWMVRNFISRVANVVLRIYKTLMRPHREYCTQSWAPLLRHGNWNVILRLEGIQRRVTKIIKE